MTPDKVLASLGTSSNSIVLKLTEFEGCAVLDMRKYYADRKTRQQLPTRKGLSLTDKTYAFLRRALEVHDSEITAWLARNQDGSGRSMASRHAEDRQKETNRYLPAEIRVSLQAWKSPEFFEVVCRGGEHEITLNQNHPFVAAIVAKTSGDEQRRLLLLLGQLIVSFSRAAELFEAGRLVSAEVLIDMLRMNWGMYLENYAKE